MTTTTAAVRLFFLVLVLMASSYTAEAKLAACSAFTSQQTCAFNYFCVWRNGQCALAELVSFSAQDTWRPSSKPSTKFATLKPSKRPSRIPTTRPTKPTTKAPGPTLAPSKRPSTQSPTSRAPTKRPSTQMPTSVAPTKRPTVLTKTPTKRPTVLTKTPTRRPILITKSPTRRPTIPTKSPSARPTSTPSTLSPTRTGRPTFRPTPPTTTAPPTLPFSLGKLVGSASSVQTAQGMAVAVNADYCLVGGSFENQLTGAAWLFNKTSMQQVYKFTSDNFARNENGTRVSAPQFGQAVALHVNGTRVAIGAPYDNNRLGAVFVFEAMNASSWREVQKLTFADPWEVAGSYSPNLVGYSVALGRNRLLVGVPGYNFDRGIGLVYVWNGTEYVFESKLVPAGGVWFSQAGISVSINQEGNVAILGAPSDNYYTGATWLFTRTGTTWTQKGAKLVGAQASPSRQGWSVSLNAAGTRALVGMPDNDAKIGGGWIFEPNSKGVWTAHTFLQGNGLGLVPEEGFSVSLNAAGTMAVMGGPRDSVGVGSAYVYVINPSTGLWEQRAKLIPPIWSRLQYGYSVAAYGDRQVIIGAPYDSNILGATYVVSDFY